MQVNILCKYKGNMQIEFTRPGKSKLKYQAKMSGKNANAR